LGLNCQRKKSKILIPDILLHVRVYIRLACRDWEV
jgi:hypothetical protein